VIVMLAQMAEHQCAGREVQIVADKIGNHFVRQVPSAAHHALLHGPRIRANFEHLGVVVRFDQQQIRAAQVHFDGIGQVAQVRCDSDLDALRANAETDRIDGVVRHGEAIDVDIANREPGTGLKAIERRLEFFPIDRLRGEPRDEDRLAALFREREQARHVIGMFVRDQDAVEVFFAFADGIEAGDEFFAAEAGIDEDTRAFGGNERGVAGTAARENADLDYLKLLLSILTVIGGENNGVL